MTLPATPAGGKGEGAVCRAGAVPQGSAHRDDDARGMAIQAQSVPTDAVSTEDRTINPDLERFMAKRMGARTIEVKASHLSLISHPDAITSLILEALAV